MTTPPPTDIEIETRRSEIDPPQEVPVVCFSGFTPEEKDALGRVCFRSNKVGLGFLWL